MVSSIINNEVYAGTWYDNKYRWVSKTQRKPRPREEWVPVLVPPIITRELWEAAQVRLAQNRRQVRGSKRQYLLAGALRCADCGSAYTGHSTVGNAGRTTYSYYACRGNTPEYKNRRCRQLRVKATEAETLIRSFVQPYPAGLTG